MYVSKLIVSFIICIVFVFGLLLIENIHNDYRVVLASIVSESGPLSSSTNSSLSESVSDLNYTTYNDNRMGVSFEYPSSWTLNERINRFIDVSTVEVYNGLNSFKVIKSQSSSDTELVDRLGGLEDTLEIIIPKDERIIEQINENKYTIDGEDTASIVTAIDGTSNISDLGVERIVVIHDNVLYTLAYQDTTDRFDSNESQQTFNHMLSSFIFVDSPGDNDDNDDNTRDDQDFD